MLRPRAVLLPCAIVLLAACTQPEDGAKAAVDPPRPLALRRLSKVQFANAVKALVGDSVVVPDALPPDAKVDGLSSVGGTVESMSSTAVEKLEKAVQSIAAQVVASESIRTRLVPCAGGPSDAACLRSSVEAIGKRAWRRPLEPAELDAVLARAEAFRSVKGTPWAALEGALLRLLQSPHFVYVVERGAQGRATPFELATRISFFLTDAPPDEALLAAAGDGSLPDPDVLRAQVDRLLATPAARTAVRRFFSEIYGIDRLHELQKDSRIFVHMSRDLTRSAEEQTLGDLERIVFDADADFRTFFTNATTHVDRRLAALYGIPAPTIEGFAPVIMPPERRGFLGQASFLAVQSHPTSTSAVLRGRFVRTVLLCGTVPAPPVNVNTGLPEPDAKARTLRERVAVHLENQSCRACHALMDPVGLGLEQFDGLGGFRTTEAGATIDTTGELDGRPFADAVELGQAITEHPDFGGCFVRHAFRHATAGRETTGESALLAALSKGFVEGGYRVRPLLSAIARSEAFTKVGEVVP